MGVSGAWLHHPGTQAVLGMLGPGAYLVGGCVRNDLMGLPVVDIDIATDLVPEQVLQRAQEAGFRTVLTGIDHGTVTVIAHGLPHEVTTFRRDVETDGRHAVVRFCTDICEDARRRDFTMNALYADASGALIDPLNGLPDLLARRVRFIEEAAQRIAEDHLRILRFFRFQAWYGDPEQGIDSEGLAACAAAVAGIVQLSAERITAELVKLLCAPDPAPAVAAMAQSGVLNAVLPGADARSLPLLVHLETTAPRPMRRLAILGGDTTGLCLSRAQRRALDQLRAEMGGANPPGALAQQYGADVARQICELRAAQFEQPLPVDLEHELTKGANAIFPVKAADLMPLFQGPALGAELLRLKELWIASGFTLTRDDLLK